MWQWYGDAILHSIFFRGGVSRCEPVLCSKGGKIGEAGEN